MTALRRFLILGEETSQAWCPDWYPLMRAARYLHVPPWDLLDKPFYWQAWALAAEQAENEAQAELARRASE